MAQKKVSITRQKIHQIYEENELAGIKQNQTRARSVTIGTAGGRMIEVGMRGDHSNLWFLLSAPEAIDIIGQLAAAAGVEVSIVPRKDFSTYRDWDSSLPSINWMNKASKNKPFQEIKTDKKPNKIE